MNFKKIFMVIGVSLFVGAVLIEAGLRIGMPDAVKLKVEELDEKIIIGDGGVDGEGAGPAPVDLGPSGYSAGNFAILAKTAITTTGTTDITGDLGISPSAASDITGFSLTSTSDSSGEYSTSSQVTGKVYASDYTSPTPAKLTEAVSNMETAYTDAAGRDANYTEVGSGDIGGMTLKAGTYKWGTGVTIPTDVTLDGGPNDVWIFQIAKGITLANGKSVNLTGGALPENIYWQAAETVSIGTNAKMQGVILAKTDIDVKTDATVNGRLLAQTAVTLDANTVTQP